MKSSEFINEGLMDDGKSSGELLKVKRIIFQKNESEHEL